jgi:hypothetical protein
MMNFIGTGKALRSFLDLSTKMTDRERGYSWKGFLGKVIHKDASWNSGRTV